MKHTMAHQLRGSQVSSILNPANGYRGELARKGVQPKNHMRDNLRLIREKERENREKKDNPESKNVFKLSKFQNVSSTLKKNLEVSYKRFIFLARCFAESLTCHSGDGTRTRE